MAAEKDAMGRLRDWAFGEECEGASSFEHILAEELEDIEISRRQRCQPPLSPAQADPVARARTSGLIGLALSGGGIRSATFSLGVIQALAAADLLRRFDYLSTVSGGGYIGAWLTAWIQRSRRGVLKVQRLLRKAAVGAATPPLDFIRDYSNYLAPRTGLFSTDSWTIASVWLRNTVLNQAVILLLFAWCLLLPRILGLVTPWVARYPLPDWFPYRAFAPVLPGTVATLLMLIAVLRIAQNLLWFEAPDHPKARKDEQSGVVRLGGMLVVAAWLGAAALWQARLNPFTPWVIGVLFTLAVFFLGRASGFETCFRRTLGPTKGFLWPFALAMSAVGSGLTGTALTHALGLVFDAWAKRGPAAGWHLVVWGGPLMLLLMTTVGIVQIGLMGRWLPDDRREWWSRLGAWMFILMAGCLGVSCVSVYGPLLVARLFETFPRFSQGFTIGWALTTLGGVIAGNSSRSGDRGKNGKKSNPWVERLAAGAPIIAISGVLLAVATLLNLVLAAGSCAGYPSEPYPPVAVTQTTDKLDLQGRLPSGDQTIRLSIPLSGIVTQGPAPAPFIAANISAVCRYKHDFFPGWRFLAEQHWNLLGPLYDTGRQPPAWDLQNRYWQVIWFGFIAIGAVTWFLAWRIDINEFSLHHFYKNRLVRCYLGATNPDRAEKVNPFTGFAATDDVLMARLRPVPQVSRDSRQNFLGPCLIVNGTLNFTSGERLAWQERKAASFIFTPRHCGFDGAQVGAGACGELEAQAYRPTSVYAYPQENRIGGIHLGTAVAISGAAASPNMGYHTSASVAFLLTLFNVRLGWWLGNPRHTRKWRRSGPACGLLYLLNELFGSATTSSDYVYLSDGGHFENLAIYELVRRKCRLIVACDAEQDGQFKFGGLGNAVRKCRTDFGVDIDIDLRPLLDRDEFGRTSTHVAIGTIDYHDGQPPGTLVYLKSSLIKPALHDEPVDVLEYAMRAEGFPHQSTGDQFFDASQFESYRRLGLHIGQSAIQTLADAGAL